MQIKNTNLNLGKTVILMFIAVFLFASCDLFRSVPKEEKVYEEDPEEIRGGKVYNPETGETEVVDHIPENMDTVNWKRNPSTDAPPIGDNNSNENPDIKNPIEEGSTPDKGGNMNIPSIPTTMKGTYEVAMMLPFVTNRFNVGDASIYSKSEWAIQYYGGAKLALEKLSTEGINLNVHVLDTEGSENKVRNEIQSNPFIHKADMIIAPYRSVNVRTVAEYGKSKQIPIVSPYSAASSLSLRNQHLIQVNPSLDTHIEAITKDIAKKGYPSEQVVLVVRDKAEEKARLTTFQDALRQINQTDSLPRFKEFVVEESVGYDALPIAQYINRNSTTVFVIPSWSSEVFVNSFLRQIEIARTRFDNIIVYGMPQWMDYANTDYNYYEKLNVRVTSAFFIDRSNLDSRTFRQKFYDTYGTKADEAAYLGYDVTLYFGRQLNKRGTQFQQYLPEYQADVLHSKFMFEPVYKIIPGSDANAPIERFENKFVHILKFKDYQWQKDI